MTQRKLHIGLSLAPTWLSGDGWRQDNSNIEGVFSADFAIDLARRAEAAHLDFVFRPDVSCLTTEIMETAPGFASLDPTVLLAAVARATSRIGWCRRCRPPSTRLMWWPGNCNRCTG